jgi:CBS domain-containing protein
VDDHLSDLVALSELRAADVMEVDVKVVAEHESLAAAVGILVRSGCQFVPVVRGGRLVGLLDERAVRAFQRGTLSGAASVAAHAQTGAVVRHDTPLAEVVATVRRAPTEVTAVVDAQGMLLGLITTSRLVALLDAATHARSRSHRGAEPPGRSD